jgi:predicted ArsR family transcriptional regulator
MDFNRSVSRMGVLADPVRRELYRFVCTQTEPVSRDGAAAAVDITRHQAKFHLDRLEAEGLLEADYVRLTGRTGPGAGRPAKRYRRSRNEFFVALPAREYELAGQIMAEAITDAERTDLPIDAAVRKAAARHGALLVDEVDQRPSSPDDALDLAVTLLDEHGYEPRRTGQEVLLANCPFRALASQHPELVCNMNLALVEALMKSAAPGLLDVRLDPGVDRCCLALSARPYEHQHRAP